MQNTSVYLVVPFLFPFFAQSQHCLPQYKKNNEILQVLYNNHLKTFENHRQNTFVN